MPKDKPADLTPADPSEQAIEKTQQPEIPAAQPTQEPMQTPQVPEDETEQISEMVGVVKPWEKVDLYLDNWEYRVWEGWMGSEPDKKADLLEDVLHQFDNNATVMKGPSKSDPNAITYSFKFSLGGGPDGVVDAITKINEAFLALDQYKVVSGKLYAIVYYADGEENTMDLTPQLKDSKGAAKGVDINDAVQMALDAVTEGHAPESQWERPKACPECGAQLPNSNDAIAEHYASNHPDAEIANVYKEEASDMDEWASWMSGLPGPTTSDLDEYGRPYRKSRRAPISPKDLEKDESMQFCSKCGQTLGMGERQSGFNICQRCIDDINAGKEPGSWKNVGQTLAHTEAQMPDLSYRESPMGVNAAQIGQEDQLMKVEEILKEVEDIYSEHEFYVRIRDMLVDLANIVDMINEPTASPALEPQAVAPQVQPHLQTQEVGPNSDMNKQEAVKDPSGGKPHTYTQGKLGQCAICGLPATHYSHYGY